MIEDIKAFENSDLFSNVNKKRKSKNSEDKLSKLTSTYFRNGLKSNLDLTTLADTKAGILISVNGFILTVVMTASGFVVHNTMMNLVFASIILTALVSIVFAVFAIRPRSKEKLMKSIPDVDDYKSLLFYSDMATMHPNDFLQMTETTIKCSKSSSRQLTTHLHILGLEIKKKYFWLKQAYTFFSVGLIVSVSLAIYGLVFIEQTPFNKISTGNISYKKSEFENIFEPSGVVQLSDGKILVVEDDSKAYLSLINLDENGYLSEVGKLGMSRDDKKIFRKKVDDLEALTNDGDTIYAITSHSLTKDNQSLTSRNKLIKFDYKNERLENFISYDSLKEDIFIQYPEIFKNNGFTINKLNIEGLAYDDSREVLLVALRGPLIKEKAIILQISNPKQMFNQGNKVKFLEPIFLNLNSLGIRDITYDKQKNGFWVIAGSSNNRESRLFELWFLSSDLKTLAKPTKIPNLGYAEGISIVKTKDNKQKLLIVEDNGQKPNKSANYILLNKGNL